MAFVGRGFRAIATASMLLVASAGGHLAHSLTLKDAKPHNGVAAAHTMPVQGIDVSYWQGDIDWQKVGDAGVHFAYIKATEGRRPSRPEISRQLARGEAGRRRARRLSFHLLVPARRTSRPCGSC